MNIRDRQQGIFAALVALGMLAGTAPVRAQENAETFDRIDLSASAESEIENDLTVAIVFAEVEANDQDDAANEVNTAIAWAADRARRADGIEVETAQYSTRPVYANGRRIVGWVVRQSLRLQSQDAGEMSELLGTLQERVAIQSVNFDVSKAARDAAEDSLIAEAIAQFSHRADLVAGELGREGFRIVRMSIGTSGREPIFVTGARMRMAEMDAAPEMEAGVQAISVSVNGTIELNPAR